MRIMGARRSDTQRAFMPLSDGILRGQFRGEVLFLGKAWARSVSYHELRKGSFHAVSIQYGRPYSG